MRQHKLISIRMADTGIDVAALEHRLSSKSAGKLILQCPLSSYILKVGLGLDFFSLLCYLIQKIQEKAFLAE